MKRWEDLLLKTKMFISFSIVAMIVVGITCLSFYYKNVGDVKNQTISLSKIISKQFSEMLDLYIQSIEELSLAISIDTTIQSSLFDYYRMKDPIEKEALGYKLNPLLFNFSYPKTYVQGVSIHTLDGQSYRYTKLVPPEPVVSFSVGQRNRLMEQPDGKPFALIPIRGERTNRQAADRIVAFVRKINKIPTQQTMGFVTINVNINAFKMVLANAKANEFENSMQILIVDDEGQLIYENGGHGSELSQADQAFAHLQQIPAEGELKWKNIEYLYTMERSAYTGWNTMILIPKDVVLLKQKRIQEIVVIVGLITMLLIAAVSYYLSHQMTLPLHKLMRKMSRVEQGDFNQRMEPVGGSEIGKLSGMYNLMLDSITRLIREVYELKLAEKNAQLSALHAQINPHFLYNTLNIMKSISRLRGIEEVAEISESLAGLFQYSMKNLHQPVTLREEIEHIDNYFKIQQHRFGSRLELAADIPERLLSASILKLTVQPLVENAVNHGLRRTKKGGRIHISAAESGGVLTVTVADNGEGMAPERRKQLQEALGETNALNVRDDLQGIGLLNIHQRIQLFFGGHYGLQLTSEPGAGTTVTLSVPYFSGHSEKGDIAL